MQAVAQRPFSCLPQPCPGSSCVPRQGATTRGHRPTAPGPGVQHCGKRSPEPSPDHSPGLRREHGQGKGLLCPPAPPGLAGPLCPPPQQQSPTRKGHSEGWDGGTWNHGVHPGIQHCLPAPQPRPQHFGQRGISPAWAGGCWQAGQLPAPWGTRLHPRGVNSPAGGNGSPFPFRPRGASVAPRRESGLGTQGPSGRGCPGCTRSGCPGLPGAGVSWGLLLPASR